MATKDPKLGKQYMSSGSAPKKAPIEPRPSASILLISPSNQILLLHRVKTSSSFASAHVFPGGNLSASQDGDIPGVSSPSRHVDGPAYRIGAIRECFEESGILLAHRKGSSALLEVSDAERDRARKEIHAGRLRFVDWVAQQGGELDAAGLIPYTRWVTPTNVPKRFTTQMYLYFLPLEQGERGLPGAAREAVIPVPTSDGGVEHTAAAFASCDEWLRRARAGEIILFPPQFFLMYMIAPHLAAGVTERAALQKQRDGVMKFLQSDSDGKATSWAQKCISPTGILMRKSDGRSVLALDKPGPELKNSTRRGDEKWVVLVKFGKGGPTNVEIRERKEILQEEREGAENSKL